MPENLVDFPQAENGSDEQTASEVNEPTYEERLNAFLAKTQKFPERGIEGFNIQPRNLIPINTGKKTSDNKTNENNQPYKRYPSDAARDNALNEFLAETQGMKNTLNALPPPVELSKHFKKPSTKKKNPEAPAA